MDLEQGKAIYRSNLPVRPKSKSVYLFDIDKLSEHFSIVEIIWNEPDKRTSLT